MDVAFKMVDGDERQPLREGKRLRVGNSHQQSPGQAGTGGDGDGVQIGEGDAGLGESFADDRDNGAQMLAAGQLRDHPAVARVRGDLRGHDR